MFKKNREFTEAFDKYYAKVFGAVCTKVSDPDDAEDICQRVFVKFFHKMESVADAQKWLFGALRLEILAYYKKKGDKKADLDENADSIELSFVNGYLDIKILLKEALQDNSVYRDETGKELLELIAIHKFTYEEAGKLLGLSKRQVRYKYGQVVNRLLEFLAKKGIKSLEDLL